MKSVAIISGSLSAGVFICGRSMCKNQPRRNLSRWSSGRVD